MGRVEVVSPRNRRAAADSHGSGTGSPKEMDHDQQPQSDVDQSTQSQISYAIADCKFRFVTNRLDDPWMPQPDQALFSPYAACDPPAASLDSHPQPACAGDFRVRPAAAPLARSPRPRRRSPRQAPDPSHDRSEPSRRAGRFHRPTDSRVGIPGRRVGHPSCHGLGLDFIQGTTRERSTVFILISRCELVHRTGSSKSRITCTTGHRTGRALTR